MRPSPPAAEHPDRWVVVTALRDPVPLHPTRRACSKTCRQSLDPCTRSPRRSGSCSSFVKESIEVLHRPSHRLLDGSSDERPIEETRKTRSRLIFDDEPVYAAIARGFTVAFMANIG